MIATEMREWFDVLQDKYNTPYFTDNEKDEFLTDAQWDFINEYIGDNENAPQLGKNKSAVAAISTLITTVPITTAADGQATDTLINTALSTKEIILPLALKPATGEAAHFLNHNDIGKAEANTFKAGIATAPNYTIENGLAQLYPKMVYTALEVTALTKPLTITDLPEHIHRKQVAKAMTKTGLVTEDEALTMMERVTNG
jgi:hypothetical protein